MSQRQPFNSLYGFPTPLNNQALPPIVSLRTPTTTDYAPIGQVWIYTTGNAAYILVSIVSNVAQWNLLEAGGSSGSFSTLTSTGATTLATTGASVNTFGNTIGATSVTISAGTGGIVLSSAGNVKMAPGTVSNASYAATLSTQVGQVTLTGQTLASASTQVLTITNTLCTTSSPLFVSVDNLGTNDAQLTITRVEPKAGSFEVTVKNNGAAALNGDIHVNFWLLQ